MKAAFVQLVESLLLKATIGLVGWRAWVAKLVIKLLMKAVNRLATYIEVKHEVKKDLKEYEKVINDPKSSADDIRDGASDFLK